jgi:hypothetical protein
MGVRKNKNADAVAYAATGIYLAICVDGRFGSLKTASGSKRKSMSLMWKVDIFKVADALARHGLIDESEAMDDDMFFYLRNGYISLRKVLRKRNALSLEKLLTQLVWDREDIAQFCEKFRVEAGKYLIKEAFLFGEGEE